MNLKEKNLMRWDNGSLHVSPSGTNRFVKWSSVAWIRELATRRNANYKQLEYSMDGLFKQEPKFSDGWFAMQSLLKLNYELIPYNNRK